MQHGPEGFDDACRHAEIALDLMRRHAVVPDPRNFAVWYRYAAGGDSALVAAIDALIAEGEPFDEERNAELFDRYVGAGAEREALRTAGDRLQTAAEEALGHVREAERDTTAYGNRLADLSCGLAGTTRLSDVDAVARSLMSETRDILRKTTHLERRLDTCSREIDDLDRHLQTLRQETLTDALTGLANRKAFDLRLREETMQALERDAPLSLLLADIDQFAAFNDSYGRAVGDEALKIIARRLSEAVKGRDTVARHGGEEFAVILPRTALSGALTVADHLRLMLADKTLQHRYTRERYGTLTLSVGVAQFRPGESRTALLQRADDALRRAKAGGRNRVAGEAASLAATGATQ